ncbi:hypothetical protein TNCV_4277551 [Trichonephila clavipes]|nr:hypothetical protein TNCV_4277551 [Trichonephila clavipes]
MNKIRKIPAGMNFYTVSSEEFIAVDDDKVCTAPIKADEISHFGVGPNFKKNSIDADSDDENKMNNAVPVSTSSETKNIMKRVSEVI